MRRILTVAVTALSIASVACGKDSTGPASIAGTYNLQTVNNAGLPFTTSQDATYKAEILSWAVTLKDDKTYSYVASLRANDNGNVSTATETSSGTYTLSGSTLTMVDPSDPGFPLVGTLAGNTLTIVIDATPVGIFTLVFKR